MVQQSKARHKEDFPLAFAPVIAEAASIAYKGATPDVQNKVRRVVEVWRDRSVFEGPIQSAIEARLDGQYTGSSTNGTTTDQNLQTWTRQEGLERVLPTLLPSAVPPCHPS